MYFVLVCSNVCISPVACTNWLAPIFIVVRINNSFIVETITFQGKCYVQAAKYVMDNCKWPH